MSSDKYPVIGATSLRDIKVLLKCIGGLLEESVNSAVPKRRGGVGVYIPPIIGPHPPNNYKMHPPQYFKFAKFVKR